MTTLDRSRWRAPLVRRLGWVTIGHGHGQDLYIPWQVRRWRGLLQSFGDVISFMADDGTFSGVRSTFWALTTLYREHRIMLSEILMEYDAWDATEGER